MRGRFFYARKKNFEKSCVYEKPFVDCTQNETRNTKHNEKRKFANVEINEQGIKSVSKFETAKINNC